MKTLKKILYRFLSMQVTALLTLVFAATIGYATFIEGAFGADTAKIRVYNSIWFEIMLLLLVLNLIGSLLVNRVFSLKKWSIFLFHTSFVIIALGAAITRYSGNRGIMHLRIGSGSDEVLSEEKYVSISASDGQNIISKKAEVSFSGKTRNRFRESLKLGNQVITIENERFIPSVVENIIENENGIPSVSLVVVGQQKQRIEFALRKGEQRRINDIVFSFGNPSDKTTILINETDNRLTITAPDSDFSAGNVGSELISLPRDEEFPFNERVIYQVKDISFLLKFYVARGIIRYDDNPANSNAGETFALRVRVSAGDKSEILHLPGSKGMNAQPVSITLNDINVVISYGSVLNRLPFSLYMNDLQIERYPGSDSPSSIEGHITIIDSVERKEFPYRVSFNSIMKYKGYRFFQSSFDQDEKGTILLVNYDNWGTSITYFGYIFMMLGMLFTTLNKNSRFIRLIRALRKFQSGRTLILIIVFTSGVYLKSGAQSPDYREDSDKSHAKSFGELLVQGKEGRIETVNSVSSKILRKIHNKNHIEGLSAVEVFLDMNVNPGKWVNKKIIKVSRSEIKRMLGMRGEYLSYNDVMSGGYKLSDQVKSAYGKNPSERTGTDKEIIKLDERINILYLVLKGDIMKIFPIPGDPGNKWITLNDQGNNLPPGYREFAIRVFSNYLVAVSEAENSGNWDSANGLLTELKDNQLEFGKQVIPGNAKIKLENFYTNFNIFGKLAVFYLLAGSLLLGLVFLSILRPNVNLGVILKPIFILVMILFSLHTAGLGIRWYISDHPPLSNGYESMIFISWATCLSGLVFGNKSQMTVAVTTILSAISLFVAGLNWMNPEITNLIPVLQSPWLLVHVAIVISGYGFLGAASLLGFINLILIILRNEKNSSRINNTIKELIYIIEISLISGLFLLTAGTFIGAIWANESWGRYWGWDPKETWSLITILVYSIIVHMHKVPSLNGYFQKSTAAFIGFGSVLMTYFGVNYFMSGLHSYASEVTLRLPGGVYIVLILIVIIIIYAQRSYKATGKSSESIDLIEDE